MSVGTGPWQQEFGSAGKKTAAIRNYTGDAEASWPSEACQVPEDFELVRQVGRGDEAAFRALVEREAPYLYGIAQALAGNAADAEDLVQETFAGMLKTRFRREASVRTWLVQILVRRVALLRRSQRWPRRHQSLESDTADVPTSDSDHPHATAGSEARLDLATMLASLSPEHQAVLVLRELEGLSYAEMAAALGVPRGTVESRLHRARAELRRRFEGYF